MKQKHIAQKEQEYRYWLLDVSNAPHEFSFVPFIGQSTSEDFTAENCLFKNCLISERCPNELIGIIHTGIIRKDGTRIDGQTAAAKWEQENPRWQSIFRKNTYIPRKSRFGRIGRY